MPSVSRGHPVACCDLNGMILLLVVSSEAASTPQVSMSHITLKPVYGQRKFFRGQSFACKGAVIIYFWCKSGNRAHSKFAPPLNNRALKICPPSKAGHCNFAPLEVCQPCIALVIL